MVVISDLHLGNPFSLAGQRLAGFLEFVRDEDYSLCINGDGLEIVQASFVSLAADAIAPLAQLRRLVAAGKRFYYVVGNHDIALEHLLDSWLGHHICPFLNVRSGDSRIRVEHGHLYDPFFIRSPRAYDLLTRAAGPLLHLYPDVYYLWSGYQRLKGRLRRRLRRGMRTPSVYHEAASVLLQRGFDVVVFGHTHKPEISDVPGGVYVNSGNWMRSSTFVVIEEGSVSLRRWHDRSEIGRVQLRLLPRVD